MSDTPRIPNDREVFALLARLDERSAQLARNVDAVQAAQIEAAKKMEGLESRFVLKSEQTASYRVIGVMILVATAIVTLVQLVVAKGGP